MASRRCHRFLSLIFLLCAQSSFAQVENVENFIFWEVTGNNLAKPSYLFGSNHLLGSRHVDSLKNVNEKFTASEIFVMETIFDSSHVAKMMSAAVMRDTTLDQLLSPEWFHETEDWLREVSGFDNLSAFNQFCPVTIQVMLLNMLQKRLYGESGRSMDTYFQDRATAMNKKAFGLESIDEQLHALFHSASYRRQASMLMDFIYHRETAEEELKRFNQLYLNQNLSALEITMIEKYSAHEIDVMLDDRTNRWIGPLIGIFEQGSAFVVVGALHLAGESGIVHQLRRRGYYVTPIRL